MLAGKPCVFDDKTGLKWKWVKKLIASMVVLPELSSLFVKISICNALLSRNLFNDMMHTKWMCYALTQGIKTIKTFIKYTKSATVDKFITKKSQGCFECWVHWNKIKTIKSRVPSINYPYFANVFKFLL